MLIVGRAVAGMGGAGLVNGALTIIASSVPLIKRPRKEPHLEYSVDDLRNVDLSHVLQDWVSMDDFCFADVYILVMLGILSK